MRAVTQQISSAFYSFAGLPGAAWLTAVLLSPSARVDEHLTPEEIADPRTRYVQVDGRQVAYHAYGDGEQTVMLLHGFGSRLETWHAVQQALGNRCRTVAIDLWGFGASARPPALSPRMWTRQVLGVMDALGIKQAILAGHSLGGRVAVMAAAQEPGRIHAVSLLDADFGQSSYGYLLLQNLTSLSVVSRLLRRLRGNPKLICYLMQMAYGRAYSITQSGIDRHHAPLLVRGTAAALEHLCAAPQRENDLSASLAHLHCPVQILWGEDDRIIPTSWAYTLARKLPHAQLSLLPGTGHLPQDECPELVATHLSSFLDSFSTVIKSGRSECNGVKAVRHDTDHVYRMK